LRGRSSTHFGARRLVARFGWLHPQRPFGPTLRGRPATPNRLGGKGAPQRPSGQRRAPPLSASAPREPPATFGSTEAARTAREARQTPPASARDRLPRRRGPLATGDRASAPPPRTQHPDPRVGRTPPDDRNRRNPRTQLFGAAQPSERQASKGALRSPGADRPRPGRHRTQLFGARPRAASPAPPSSEGVAKPAARIPRRPPQPRPPRRPGEQRRSAPADQPPRRPASRGAPDGPPHRPLRRAAGRPAGPGDPLLGAGPRREALAPPKRPAFGQTAAGTATRSSEQAARRQRHPQKGSKAQGSIEQRPGGNVRMAQRTLCWLKALRSRTSNNPLPGPRACVGDQKGRTRVITARRHRPR
jgi:hypothetical protein